MPFHGRTESSAGGGRAGYPVSVSRTAPTGGAGGFFAPAAPSRPVPGGFAP
ncbi:hypothetical protein GCM10010293_64960 [Streptomyces griseoflavus]|nr:hypothetical protein GCM10010293_64960 [Streptomyces griseoflavus]